MNLIEYQECTRCIMDNTDREIVFNENGICNHCLEAEEISKKIWFPNEKGQKILNGILREIKNKNKNKRYDCILGLSGGVDSSYLAHLASREWDLRILAIHVNAGWNSEIAEANIEKIVNANSNIDLFTYVVNWEEVKDLQLAYLKSGISNQDVPQDHVFMATLYNQAEKNKIQYILNGSNFATECILPKSWLYDFGDCKNLVSIHKKFGTKSLTSYNTMSFFKRYVYYPFILNQKVIKPLNYIVYDKEKAKKFLSEKYGWVDYGKKHGESVFTSFFQNYWLPERFGFDKRKAHFSSMIVSKYMTREEAKEEMKKPLYNPLDLQRDKEFICNKLEITLDDLNKYFNSPKRNFDQYPNNNDLGKLVRNLKNKLNIKIFR